jgi:cytochrome b
MSQQEIRVWDMFVRVFHWTLVVAFTVAWLSGEESTLLHVYSGYLVLGLIVLRIVWGFIGTRYARFRDFIYRPATIKAFIRDTAARRAQRYVGHNPAGGLMILLMLVILLLTGVSGIALYGMEEHAGPLAMLAAQPEYLKDILEEVHEVLANFMVVLVLIHIAGVVVESLMHGENLARAMVTGRKRAE